MSKTPVFTDENTPSARVSTQTRPHMYVQNVPVCTGTTRTCFNTCARCAGIHGDVLNVYMGTCLSGHTVFSAFHTTPQHRTHHTDHTPHHDTRHNTTRRQTETETEGEEGTKEKTTRQEQREETRVKREKIHF